MNRKLQIIYLINNKHGSIICKDFCFEFRITIKNAEREKKKAERAVSILIS
jgi:hypothetical protein